MEKDDIPPENSDKLLSSNLIPYSVYFENPSAVFSQE
jgi:hypothetical protein